MEYLRRCPKSIICVSLFLVVELHTTCLIPDIACLGTIPRSAIWGKILYVSDGTVRYVEHISGAWGTDLQVVSSAILESTRDVDDAADARRKECVFLNVHEDGTRIHETKAGLCPRSRGEGGRTAEPQRVPVRCAVPI